MQIEIKVEELRKKKIFVATPMYGGMCHGMYAKSCIDLATLCANYGVECRFFYIFNESLITRARNYLVDEFLRTEGFTHLMFIDSDIHFDPRDVLSLAALCDDDKPIIGGPYGKKCIAWEKIVQAVDSGIADKDPEELSKFVGDFVFNPVQGTQELKINEPVNVLEIGTGFMMVQDQFLINGEKHILNFIINQIIIVQSNLKVIDIFMHILIQSLIMNNICLWVHRINLIDICQKIMHFVS